MTVLHPNETHFYFLLLLITWRKREKIVVRTTLDHLRLDPEMTYFNRPCLKPTAFVKAVFFVEYKNKMAGVRIFVNFPFDGDN
jgi:hypothetical protein